MEPASTAMAAGLRDTVLAARAESLALRLLSGSGRPSLFGYAPGPSGTCEALHHGLSDDGRLLVAAIDTFDNPVVAAPDLTPVNVRLDVVKEAPEWAARVTACTIHLLGTLEWLPDEHDVPDLTRTNPLLAEVASLPGGRLGVIHTDRVVLHDSAGVTAHDFNALMARRLRTPEFPRATEELNAREALAALSPSDLDTLFSIEGTDTSVALGSRLQTTCPSLHGRVLCVDIDASGVTLMRVDEAGTRTALFPFATTAHTLGALSARMRALLR